MSTGEPSRANDLVLTYREYARKLAREIHKTLPPSVPFEDVEGAATLGLTKAAQRFDPDQGVLFTTFAYRPVRGAVFDAVRKMTGLPPRTRAKIVAEANADAVVEESADEVASAVSADNPERRAAQFSEMVSRVATVFLASSLPSGEGGIPEPGVHDDPAEVEQRAELREKLREAVKGLEPEQVELIDLLYVKGLSMEEAGVRMGGLNKATISRRHQKMIDILRQALRSVVPIRPVPT